MGTALHCGVYCACSIGENELSGFSIKTLYERLLFCYDRRNIKELVNGITDGLIGVT